VWLQWSAAIVKVEAADLDALGVAVDASARKAAEALQRLRC
jgi:hypothetical protein